MVVSGADDCTIKVWDPRKKGQAVTLNNTYQVTAVSFNDTSEQVITGGIDNDIKVNEFHLYNHDLAYHLSRSLNL